MIKKYSLLIVAFFFSATVISQSAPSDKSLSKASVSLLAGVMSSHYGGTSQFLSRTQKQSLCATLSLQVPITKVVFFSMDVAYREMGERQYVTVMGNGTFASSYRVSNEYDKLFLRIPYMRVNACAGILISDNISFHIGGYVGYRGRVNTHGSEQPDWFVDERREWL